MFTLSVTVPRITPEQVAQVEAMIPGFSTVATVPVIQNEEQAFKAATVVANKKIATAEYVSRIHSVIETDTGWNFKLIISGD
jgi:hypothetical protein